ncbi:MAG: hypothetical protein JWO19_468 [Bryobacterales bacterium]|nr:hypothetical protein [Bryobacterales bacterium]
MPNAGAVCAQWGMLQVIFHFLALPNGQGDKKPGRIVHLPPRLYRLLEFQLALTTYLDLEDRNSARTDRSARSGLDPFESPPSKRSDKHPGGQSGAG